MLIGNNLEETAYHEAGHIVVAARLGLDLRPIGIMIFEVEEDVMDGLACYWDDPSDWDKNLHPLLAGQFAQYRKFPNSGFTGSKPDNDKFFEVVKEKCPASLPSNIWDRVRERTYTLLGTDWSAVVEIADTLIAAVWIPVDENEHPVAKRKKCLDGEALLAILSSHDIATRVRPADMSKPKYEQGDYVKVEFSDETTGVGEWMWVRVTDCDDEKKLVFGTLDNEPVNDYEGQIELGSELVVSYSQIREHKKPTEFTKQ